MYIEFDDLREYITYAKQHCKPVLSEAAAEMCVKRYVEMRQEGSSDGTITATTRQLESFIRMSEALAKMQLKDTVMVEHVEEAVRLVKAALRSSFIDKSGRIDLDLMHSGVSQHEKQLRQNLGNYIKDILSEADEIPFLELVKLLNVDKSMQLSQQSVKEAIQMISDEVYVGKDDKVRLR